MTYNNLSDAEKRRFKQNNICPICGQGIDTTDNFQYLTFRDGRFIRYRFFHLYCLGKSRKSEVCTWVEEEAEKRLKVTT